MKKGARWATPEEIHARAERLRALMLDTAAEQFQELQVLKADLVIARARIAELETRLREYEETAYREGPAKDDQ